MPTRLSLLSLFLVATLAIAQDSSLKPQGQIALETDPAGAQVYINRQMVGVTPFAADMDFGRYLIELKLANYETVRQAIVLDANLPRYPFSTTLRKQTGFWTLRTSPAGADVTVNGLSVGKTPFTLANLPLGQHKAMITLSGYKDKVIMVDLNNRIPVVQNIELVSNSGELKIVTEPAGATVYLNNAEQGTTPLTLDRLVAGQTQTITVKLPGYEEAVRDLRFNAGQNEVLDLKLVPLPGFLSVNTIPKGARIYVNDEYQGEDGIKDLKLNAGAHRIRVEHPGYAPMARTVEIPKGGKISEEFRLKTNRGSITVITTPPGTSIYIDGKLKGVTKASPNGNDKPSLPFVIESIDAGEHEIKLIAKNCKDAAKKLTVKAGEDYPITAKLIRLFTPDYEVRTADGTVRGILRSIDADGIRLEISPGVTRNISRGQIRSHGKLDE